jgi:hypothetical protein
MLMLGIYVGIDEGCMLLMISWAITNQHKQLILLLNVKGGQLGCAGGGSLSMCLGRPPSSSALTRTVRKSSVLVRGPGKSQTVPSTSPRKIYYVPSTILEW